MATRKERQQQAREERKRLEAEEAATARRRRMTQLGAGAVLAAIVVVVALIAIAGSGSDSGGDTQIEGASSIERELEGLKQSGIALGDPQAKVTIAEFGDLQCPVCAQFASQVIPQLIDDVVRPGDAQLEFKNFTIIGPDSTVAAKAALAAANQGRYWEFVDLFYRNQGVENSGYVTDDFLEALARGAGVPDIDRWNTDRQDPALDSELAKVQSEATRIGFNATPSFLVEGPGGRRAMTSPSLAQLEAAVKDVS